MGYRLIAPVKAADRPPADRPAGRGARRGVAPAWRWATLVLLGLLLAGGLWTASALSTPPRIEKRVRIYRVPDAGPSEAAEVRIVRRRVPGAPRDS